MASTKASSNWLALKMKLSNDTTTEKSTKISNAYTETPRRKKRKISDKMPGSSAQMSAYQDQQMSKGNFLRGTHSESTVVPLSSVALGKRRADASDSAETLQKMILGQLQYEGDELLPGKYLAMDCEMVGVGPEGAESSLARVSVVNFYGAVLLDEFVRQRERVVDYRTEFSGIRESDMINARPFAEVQNRVADLLKNRILVGHAVFNDLKALLLSHPRPLTRDTQQCAGKQKLMKTRYPALRKLVQQELGTVIQSGEHSSVTDARATMALYRMHRKEWDKGFKPSMTLNTRKRKAHDEEVVDHASVASDTTTEQVDGHKGRNTISTGTLAPTSKKSENAFPGGGRKGVSSGLSTVVKRSGRLVAGSQKASSGDKWWKTL